MTDICLGIVNNLDREQEYACLTKFRLYFCILFWVVFHIALGCWPTCWQRCSGAGDHFYIGSLCENRKRIARKYLDSSKGVYFWNSLLEKGTSGVQKIRQYLPLHVCVCGFFTRFFFCQKSRFSDDMTRCKMAEYEHHSKKIHLQASNCVRFKGLQLFWAWLFLCVN